jgi:hypothetical protein
MRLETRILERLKSGGGSSSAKRRSSSSSTNEWALLARYAAHMKQEEDRKKVLEAHTRAEKAKEELRLQQEAAVARQKVKGIMEIFIYFIVFLAYTTRTNYFGFYIFHLCRLSVKQSELRCRGFKKKSGHGVRQRWPRERLDEPPQKRFW